MKNYIKVGQRAGGNRKQELVPLLSSLLNNYEYIHEHVYPYAAVFMAKTVA